VTEADRAAQRTVIESIRETFPDDAIVGEEEDERKTVPETGAAWVIDPIDGTSNYVRDIRVWGTAVAAVVDGEPVAAATVARARVGRRVHRRHGRRVPQRRVDVRQ